MKKRRLIELAMEEGYSAEEFRADLGETYAAACDIDLDKHPDQVMEEKMIFGGHAIVVTVKREFFN